MDFQKWKTTAQAWLFRGYPPSISKSNQLDAQVQGMNVTWIRVARHTKVKRNQEQLNKEADQFAVAVRQAMAGE
jgi:hypothetical protein